MATPAETLANVHDLAVIGAMDPTRALLAIPATVGAVGTAASMFTVVRKGEMGIRTIGEHPELQSDVAALVRGDIALATERYGGMTRRDKVKIREDTIQGLDEERLAKGIYKIVEAGLYATWPIVGGIARIPTNRRITPVQAPIIAESTDAVQIVLRPTFVWNVRRDGDNPHHARFNINHDRKLSDKERDQELEQAVAAICLDGIRPILYGKSAAEIMTLNTRETTATLSRESSDKLLEHGVELLDVLIHPPARTPEERLAQAIESLGTKDGDTKIGAAVIAAVREISDSNIIPMPPHGPDNAA